MGEREDNKLKVFKSFLDGFESEELKSYCQDMILKIPDSVWAYQRGELMCNKLKCCLTINCVLNLKYIQQKIEKPKKRDCVRIAMCFHGIHKDRNVLERWIKNTKPAHKIKEGLVNFISDLVFLDTADETGMLIALCSMMNSSPEIPVQTIRDIAIPDPENYFFETGPYAKMNFILVYQMDKEYLRKLKAEGTATEPLKSYLEEYI